MHMYPGTDFQFLYLVQVLEAFKHEMMVETGINKHTYVKPVSTYIFSFL